MGDLDSSDCSWKKMVIEKSNNEWISTIKSELGDVNSAVSSVDIDLQQNLINYENIKKEHEPDTDDYEINEPIAMVQESDPLSLQEPLKRKRRKGSVPQNESSDERAVRLAKMSAYAAQRLANETPEQRALRLKRMSEYAAKRLAHETSEQRAKRLARMSAYAAKRLASESPEQRQARLTRMSAYAARRQAMKKMSSTDTSQNLQTLDNYNTTNMMPNQS